MIKLGSRVKDMVSGFTGIATARTEYINGCARVVVDPENLDKDGKLIEGRYFDEPQLEVLEEGAVKIGVQDPGGPHGHDLPTNHRR